VPNIAPHKMALFPTFFPKYASPTAAPRQIWVSESMIQMFYCNAKEL
jgi:hypothetical protein